MIDDRYGEVSAEMLHRMIRYVRDEARRLQVMDVAVLLAHAESAAVAFSPPPASRQAGAPAPRHGQRVEH